MTTPLTNDPRPTPIAPTRSADDKEQVAKILGQIASSPEQTEVQFEALVKPVQQINDVIRPYGVVFDLSQQSSTVVTQIIDLETGDVIRQTPAVEVLRIAEQLDKVSGLLFQIKA